MGAGKSRLRLGLFPRAETAVRAGHPWVFGDSVKSQNREGEAGELAVMYDRRDRFLAVGFYDPESPIRVRIVHQGKPATIGREWWMAKALVAKGVREGAVLNERTNGARWINGESEGFPGLVADRYAGTLVVKLYSPGWLSVWEEIESVFREVFEPERLVVRLSRNLVEAAGRSGLVEGFRGVEGEEMVVFEENGLRFESAVLRGQKTGFFLDQRDNRARVEAMAAGREVLNVFSFSGGFSLYAARGGAPAVTDVDISGHALESAARNFALNEGNAQVAAVGREAVQADAFAWLEEAPERMKYDLIVVDPPSLAKREREREGALRAYERLNRLAMLRLRPGGILLAASCSAHVRKEEFFRVVRETANRVAPQGWQERWTTGHALDHPAAFVEAEYLKAICLEVG